MKITSFNMQVIDNRIHLLVDSEKQPEVKNLMVIRFAFL